MVKRALCVGCNYPTKAFGLAGGVNDAFLLRDLLQNHCGFEEDNIIVLHDVHPGQKKSIKVDPNKQPTRVNILHQLQTLVRSARQGDILFFSFSGYGLQVDDMDGYQDEGYDEAILPTDFVDGRDGDYTVIVTSDVHDILMGVPPNCLVTVVMDCDHATSVIDVSGTMDGKLVEGLKYHNFCGLKAHTVKMQIANHNRDVWQEERARAVKARPRFQPLMEIDNPKKGRLPTRPAMSRASPVAFCFSAASHGQTAMEMQTNTVVDGKETPRQQGILSFCFSKALEELRYDCTYMDLLMGIRRQFTEIKERDLPKMDQEVLMTFSLPRSNPCTMRVFQHSQGQFSGKGLAGEAFVTPAAPAVVPPPPPGFVSSQGAAVAGTGGSSHDRQLERGSATPSAGTGSTQDAIERGEVAQPPPPPPPPKSYMPSAAPSASSSSTARPPLPPPPPPAPAMARRCSSEVVNYNITPGDGGSFAVQGGTGYPSHVAGRENSRSRAGDSSYVPASYQPPLHAAAIPREPSYDVAKDRPRSSGQVAVPRPPSDELERPPSSGQFAFAGQGGLATPSLTQAQPGSRPAIPRTPSGTGMGTPGVPPGSFSGPPPLRGLTPPNLNFFAAPSSFGNSFSAQQMQCPAATGFPSAPTLLGSPPSFFK